MTDHLRSDGQQQDLAEYLRGALASHHIVNTGKRINCEECPQGDGQMGMSASRVSETSVVKELRPATER